jgi:hypothetical protein
MKLNRRAPSSAVAHLILVRSHKRGCLITFDFHGTDNSFETLYDAISDLDLDIGAYSEGTTGIIEFMIDDLSAFKEQVAMRSAELGVNVVAHDHLLSDPKTLPGDRANREPSVWPDSLLMNAARNSRGGSSC